MPSTVIEYFQYSHLPPNLACVSEAAAILAQYMESTLPDGPEKSAGMRKLLEAKDCFVRSSMNHPVNRFGFSNVVHTFSWALGAMKGGGKVRRTGWNGKGMWIAIQVPDEHSKMKLPYIFMSTVDGKLVPWLASQTDMLSEDWEVAL